MNQGFKMNIVGEYKYLTIPSFEETGLVTHCFTTRCGGVSKEQYKTLNLSFNTDDNYDSVLQNYIIVSEGIGINHRNYVFSEQVHDCKIKYIGDLDKGKGIVIKSDIKGVDGMITDRLDIPLITLYADCVPLFFLDTKNKVIALSHAGWKGTVMKIGAKTLIKMKEMFGTIPKECLVGIGPSIGPCCFEVDKTVAEQFKQSIVTHGKQYIKALGSKYVVDLWEANRIQLVEQGVKDDNITFAGICTKCNSELFFSHRRDKGITGRMAAIIQLN